jgi:CBS domain-containing protein
VVALVVDALTRRLIDLHMAELGDPPTSWAWLAMGSAARREQALRSDQDHVLVLGEEEPSGRYFGELAWRVTEGLHAAGFPRCHGGMMAANEEMRRSLDRWVERFTGWLADPGVEGSIFASILFDYRHVAGPLEAVPRLDEVIRTAPEHPVFMRHLSRRALDQRPPTGFFRHLVVEAKGEHAGTLDVKHRGIMLITELARAFAMNAGSVEKGTPARLRAASGSASGPGPLDEETAVGLEESFRRLWGLRLGHHAARVRAGLEPDDHLDPGSLGMLSRQEMREAFRIIGHAQKLLAADLGVGYR